MKPVVPSTVPYPDMRSGQLLGVKLRGQRTHRFIRYAGPRGAAETASTEAVMGPGTSGNDQHM